MANQSLLNPQSLPLFAAAAAVKGERKRLRHILKALWSAASEDVREHFDSEEISYQFSGQVTAPF